MDSNMTMHKGLKVLGAYIYFDAGEWIDVQVHIGDAEAAKRIIRRAGYYIQSLKRNADGTVYIKADY